MSDTRGRRLVSAGAVLTLLVVFTFAGMVIGSALLILVFAGYLADAIVRPLRRMPGAVGERPTHDVFVHINRALDTSVDGIRLVDLRAARCSRTPSAST